MYLKEIVTNGFKSFADKMEIKLDDEVTCIVGPNGSGKSNIVDAIRWVLGEQSVKNLRGDGGMSDVIFAGSASRKAKNVASVELIFDNSDHYLKVDYSEVSIKRRVYRSGENEYFINNNKARLKDIVNLFLDSGVGKESFNIISQGEVSKIISESNDDRRAVFEEAAGILKYKKRKEEALRKLDKTNDALDRVEDIIKELEVQVEPLKEQSEKAREYKTLKEELENLEIALIAYDIYNLSTNEEILKKEKEELDKEILDLESTTNKDSGISLKKKTDLLNLEKDLEFAQKELLNKTEEIGKLNVQLNILKEQRKNKNLSKSEEELRALIDERAKINKDISVLENEITIINNDITNMNDDINSSKNNLKGLKLTLKNYEQTLSKQDRDILTNKHKVELLRLEAERGNNLPNTIKKILEEDKLQGIYDIIGNVIKTKDEYVRCLDVAISSSKNFVIVKDEDSAKEAIRYLKNNNLGRATFFPINVIKKRYVDENTLSLLKTIDGYKGVLADLVTTDKEYKNIIYNQLGLVIIADDLDTALRISKKIDRRYKVITLAGDVINVGGSMTGGANYKGRSAVMINQEITNYINIINSLEVANKKITADISDTKEDIRKLEDKIYLKEKDLKLLIDDVTNKNHGLFNHKDTLSSISDNIDNLSSNDNTLDTKEEDLVNRFYDLSSFKEKLELKITTLKKDIKLLKEKIEEDEEKSKYKNNLIRKTEEKRNSLELKLKEIDVKLDNLLNTLSSEYSITYEKARKDYELDVEEKEARSRVSNYKAKIKSLGMVNLAAIDEYERVNTRYMFLLHQKEDLTKAIATLLEIMNEMDEVMKEEFLKTFELIKNEFKEVFRALFHGGEADLKLTTDDILTTGIEIVACPPGKKLTTISLLSGGEKTLTAISLLFAIINVRTVPFCVFDEVEAALDEANVMEFGKYLANYKHKTQFLIITHKKKTMEYADTLYGITMQESGVSKLVSVKLTNNEEII